MKKLIIRITLGLVLTGVLVACSEGFLNIAPQAALDEGTLANTDGVEAALISAYSMLDGWNHDWGQFSPPWPTAGSNWIWGSVTSDDAYKGSEPGDQGEITQLELFQWSPGNTYFEGKFKALYEGVSRANATQKLADKTEDIDEDTRSRIQGELRLLRGHFHFEAWKIWGNVPYYTEQDDDFRKTNDQDITPQIQADFQAAIDVLPVDQPQVGRVTKGVAQAYLGKLLLYKGDYAGAKTQFEAVVNSGKYSLQDCFHDIFTTSGENGTEMIFSIQASVNDGTSEGQNGNFADRLNFPHGGSPFGCCGFHQPSQNLVNAHRVDANGLPLLDSFNDADLGDTEPTDPRLDWTVGRDNVPFLDWGTHEPSWIRSRAWAGPYSPKKFTHANGQESSVGWSNIQLSPVNIPIIRYADVLLMLAECEVELNNLERARELVNLIRARAANCAQGAEGDPVAIDDAGITWATYSIGTYDSPWTDQAVARQAVRMERRLEMALEGHRFFDLRRWGVAKEVLNAYFAVEETKRTYMTATTGYEDRHDLMPLPTVQIELSKVDGNAQLQQNPGY
ncbi:MAG: RagB/SusD family nutrient uptake outer membrane protein [Bacteroidota bacterium]